VQSVAEIGGSDVSLLRIVEALDRSRYRAFVVLPSDGPLNDALRECGATVLIEPSMIRLTTTRGKGYYLRYLLQYPYAVWRLARIIRRERIDLVHTNTLHALHGFAAARVTRTPHVWHAREIVLQSRLIGALESFLARRFSDRIVTMSGAIADWFRDRSGARPEQLKVLRDGIDVARFHPRNSGARIRAELDIPREHRVAGVVCRLDHWKGVDTFLRAAALCRERFPGVTYVVAGGAIEGREDIEAELVALAGSLGMANAVRFTGWRYLPVAMPEVHAALDVLVLASEWPEPYGLVLLEAMASGKPVVATNHGGPVEICVDGETALLVQPRHIEGMAEAMLTLLRDETRATAMGKAARARVERDFDYGHYIVELQRTYDEVLSA